MVRQKENRKTLVGAKRDRTVTNNTPKWKRTGQKIKGVGRRNTVKM